ncbi:MAG: aminotransferase class V-fold PLP-dependent enzyme [Candidatus Thalassarchaeaceae archaeon]|jgi:isopenicillin-N epimerase|nr:aminotransferase class V-fold PLP-dependent enzyme [Candidatus Thalassarchaeaceae archaeon]
MSRPRKGELAHHWTLDPETCFLNHGSFGATPTVVLEEQSGLRAQIEREPVRFIERDYLGLWNRARSALSEFLNADLDGMTFVTNATAGVNTVLRSLDLAEGDEIIVPDHSYQACWNAVDFVTEKSGAKTVVVKIPFRVGGTQEVIDIVMGAVTDRTVLALIDTVTSPTGMRMPFEELVVQLQSRGVDVLLDAAHGPGIVPLDLTELDVAYCTGNCHKWLCTPKGSAFLHIRKDRKGLVRPLSISHGASHVGDAQEKFEFEFAWPGTHDPTPWLCIPKAIEYIGSLTEGGWPEIMERNHALTVEGRRIICDALGTTAPFPDSMVSALAAIEMPADGEVGAIGLEGDPFHNHLLDKYGIQVPVFPWRHHDVRYLRISAQLYNHIDEYRYLAHALKESV